MSLRSSIFISSTRASLYSSSKAHCTAFQRDGTKIQYIDHRETSEANNFFFVFTCNAHANIGTYFGILEYIIYRRLPIEFINIAACPPFFFSSLYLARACRARLLFCHAAYLIPCCIHTCIKIHAFSVRRDCRRRRFRHVLLSRGCVRTNPPRHGTSGLINKRSLCSFVSLPVSLLLHPCSRSSLPFRDPFVFIYAIYLTR